MSIFESMFWKRTIKTFRETIPTRSIRREQHAQLLKVNTDKGTVIDKQCRPMRLAAQKAMEIIKKRSE